ncbi:MAG: ABC transporter permease [Defluviitaleaceae bacterium]|nr:ABC transporter permease [Defluviitaleaceae bacterium]
MHKFILKRLLMMVPVMLGVMFIIFTLNYITPGDPVRQLLGERTTQEDIDRVTRELGLDRPFAVQFGNYVRNAFRLDFGRSFVSRQPVFTEIASRFPTTMRLAIMGVIVSVLIGVPLGIISATKQYSIFDNTATVVGLLGVSIPNFALGLILVLAFSVRFRIFPPSGFSRPIEWVLPAITIGMSSAAIVMRMTRSSMLEVIRQDYIRTARAKGQKESKVIFRHALKNALIPVITVVGLQFGFLLGGAILTESIFAIPGLGRFMVDSIRQFDYPMVQGGVLFIAITFSFVNLFVDILYAFVDPRIRSQYK